MTACHTGAIAQVLPKATMQEPHHEAVRPVYRRSGGHKALMSRHHPVRGDRLIFFLPVAPLPQVHYPGNEYLGVSLPGASPETVRIVCRHAAGTLARADGRGGPKSDIIQLSRQHQYHPGI
ncbi:hypothetical protein ACNKHW_13175 [Shigella flexneri]